MHFWTGLIKYYLVLNISQTRLPTFELLSISLKNVGDDLRIELKMSWYIYISSPLENRKTSVHKAANKGTIAILIQGISLLHTFNRLNGYSYFIAMLPLEDGQIIFVNYNKKVKICGNFSVQIYSPNIKYKSYINIKFKKLFWKLILKHIYNICRR